MMETKRKPSIGEKVFTGVSPESSMQQNKHKKNKIGNNSPSKANGICNTTLEAPTLMIHTNPLKKQFNNSLLSPTKKSVGKIEEERDEIPCNENYSVTSYKIQKNSDLSVSNYATALCTVGEDFAGKEKELAGSKNRNVFRQRHIERRRKRALDKLKKNKLDFSDVCDFNLDHFLVMNNEYETFSDRNISTCSSPKKKKRGQNTFGTENVEDMSITMDSKSGNRDLLNVSEKAESCLENHSSPKKKVKLKHKITENTGKRSEDSENSGNQSMTNDLLHTKTVVSPSRTKKAKKHVQFENGPLKNICTYTTSKKKKKQSVQNIFNSQYEEDMPGTEGKSNINEGDSSDMSNVSQKNTSALENFANHRKRKKNSKRKVSENEDKVSEDNEKSINHSLTVDSFSDASVGNYLVTEHESGFFLHNNICTSATSERSKKKKKKKKSKKTVLGSQNVEDMSVTTDKGNNDRCNKHSLNASYKDGLVSENYDFANRRKGKKNLKDEVSENREKNQEDNANTVNHFINDVPLCTNPIVSPSCSKKAKKRTRLTDSSHNNIDKCTEDTEHYLFSKQISSPVKKKSKKERKSTTECFNGLDSILSPDIFDTSDYENSRIFNEDDKGDEPDYDSLLREEIDKAKEKDLQENFQDLLIVLNHEIPPLHLLPTSTKRGELLALGMREGHFSKAENAILTANWEKFVEDYGITDPAIFVSPQRKTTLRNSLKQDFLQYMGNGLPNRSLLQIYHHFAHLCVHLKRGTFSRKEDNIILKAIEENISEPFSILSRVLKRSRQSIHKRYVILKTNTPVRRQKWTLSFSEQVVKALMEVMGVSHVSSLQDVHIPLSVWHDVEKKLGVPTRKLRQIWNYQLHVQLFAKSPLEDKNVFRKIINWLHKQKPETEKDINYQLSTEIIPGSTSTYMWSVFRRIRRKYNFDTFRSLQDFIECLYRDKHVFDEEKGRLCRYKMEDNGSLSKIFDSD